VLVLVLCGGCPAAALLPVTPAMDPMGEQERDDDDCVLDSWEDGDTAHVDCGSGAMEVVRLQGIEAAETGTNPESKTRAKWQADLWKLPYEVVIRCGEAAVARAKEICPEGSTVLLVGDDTDKLDRRLAHVRCAGQNVNVRLLQEGHAGHHAEPADPARPHRCHM
jgi:endonuclease YncB( thermonuclease family)